MKDIRLIASDMDHTLLTEQSQLPPGLKERLQKLADRDILFVVASGRPMYRLKEIFSVFDQKLAYISDNGGSVGLHDDIIHKKLLETADYQHLARYATKELGATVVVCGLDSAYVSKKDEKYDSILREYYSRIRYVERLDEVVAEVNKFTLYFPEGNSIHWYDEVFAPRYGDRFSVAVSDAVWIDITPKGVNKGTAIEILGRELGVPRNQMMAFGDAYNDKEMLQAVGYGYVMANADADLHRLTGYMADTNENYGVLQVIDEVLAAQS